MIKVYADLVMKGKKTLDEVPAKIRDQVREELIRRGWTVPEEESPETEVEEGGQNG